MTYDRVLKSNLYIIISLFPLKLTIGFYTNMYNLKFCLLIKSCCFTIVSIRISICIRGNKKSAKYFGTFMTNPRTAAGGHPDDKPH